MTPLSRGYGWSSRGLNIKPVIFLVSIFGLTSLVSATLLRRQMQTLHDARDALCGGNVDFVSTTNKYGLVIAGVPPQGGRPVSDWTSTYNYKAVDELIRNREAVRRSNLSRSTV